MCRLRVVVAALLLLVAGCGNASEAQEETVAPAPQSSLNETEAPARTAVSTTTSSVAPVETAPADLPATTSAPSTNAPTTTIAAPQFTCVRVTDFASAAEQQPWRVTLDGVMGGLSSGQVEFGDSTMIFTGEIVTAGGGFSLLRTPLDFDVFVPGSFLIVRARADDRRYEMVFKDGLEGRRRQLFHEAQMPFEQSDDWQEVRVELTDLTITSNGRPVEAEPFDKDAAIEMGIILKDGVDGTFQIELDWVDVCRA